MTTTITPLAIPEVLLITPLRREDSRGWFTETWNRKALAAKDVDFDFLQDNQAHNTKAGILRGLHFQKGAAAQAKLVRALTGAIYDVAVDIRPGSPTYGQSVGATLTAAVGEQLLIPRGFAHGYCTLVDDCMVAYKVDNDYAPNDEGGVAWDDPDLGIVWPVPIVAELLHHKDTKWPRLKDMTPADL